MVNLKNLKYGFSIKQIYNYYLYKKSNKKDTILNYRPIWLLIYVSDLCNLRCEMFLIILEKIMTLSIKNNLAKNL